VDDEFLTVADIAAILKLNQQTVRNWIDRGELPAYHVGWRVRVSRRDFDAFLEAGYEGGAFPTGHRAALSVWDGVVPPAEAPSDGEPSHAVDDRR
jgi:excisionase family DNA binding protein